MVDSIAMSFYQILKCFMDEFSMVLHLVHVYVVVECFRGLDEIGVRSMSEIDCKDQFNRPNASWLQRTCNKRVGLQTWVSEEQ